MAVYLNDQAFKTAANDMRNLKLRNESLRVKLQGMYKDLTTALDTPAGHALELTGQDVLLEPIDNMSKVIGLASNILNTIIGSGGEARGIFYDKLFTEYEELDSILKNKTTK